MFYTPSVSRALNRSPESLRLALLSSVNAVGTPETSYRLIVLVFERGLPLLVLCPPPEVGLLRWYRRGKPDNLLTLGVAERQCR